MSIKGYDRTLRVAELIQRELARIMQEEMRGDTRVSLVTITAVKISKDLSHAKIFITRHTEPELIPEAVKILNRVAKQFRFLLARALPLRVTPELRFIHDSSIEQSAHLSALIDKALAEDEEKNK